MLADRDVKRFENDEDVQRIIAETTGTRKISDGEGLILRIQDGRGYWQTQFWDKARGYARSKGLGSVSELSLAAARKKHKHVKADQERGLAPAKPKLVIAPPALPRRVPQPRAAPVEASSDPPTRPTADAPFKLWAASYIAWKARKVTGPYSEKVRNQFRSFVPAWFAEMPVTEITPDHIADVLNADHPKTKQQLWQGRNSVADRLLIQIRGVLKYADIEPNPGAWERIESRVPQIERPDERQPSLPYKALPSFYARLMQDKRPVARFIQFVILTGLRRDEARLATWREVDLYERSLTIPAQRLKVKKLGDHIVPLGQAALDLLGPEGKKTDLLFPGVHAHSAQRFLEIAQEPSDVPGRFAVLHGMRSTFATWAQFHRFPEPVIQRAIAHKERNQSKGAYLRDNLLDHRRELHEAWSAYATSASGR